ncbi:MAG: SGNH/GDSL hydrolase family protein [Eggerthellaceae bacterium]|nr:SGNH/GDSL hydrolase family protein [Eggerthellaceae bacterium]
MTKRAFSVFGDSISTFEGCVPSENLVYYQGENLERTGVASVEDTWWMRVINHFDGRLLSNASFSGSMTAGAGFPAGYSDQRIMQITGSQGEHPDDILVFMGTNDYGWGSSAAQAAGRSIATPQCVDLLRVPMEVAGLASDDGLAEFETAYGLMLRKMRSSYPGSRIWCLSLMTGREVGRISSCFTYALRGILLHEYNEAISRQACFNGCTFVDTQAIGFDYEASDGTHPTNRGMRQIAEMVIAAMIDDDRVDGGLAKYSHSNDGCAAVRADALSLQYPELFNEGMRAEQWCDKPACVACDYARGAGNQWSCVCDAPESVRNGKVV